MQRQMVSKWTRPSWVLAGLGAAAFVCGVLAQDVRAQGGSDWSRYRDPQLGLSVDLPMAVFAPKADLGQAGGTTFATADDRARLALFRFDNRAGETPAQHLRRIKNDGPARFTYERKTGRFFVASGFYEGKIFYRRCNFPARGGPVRCLELRYPAAEKRAWDRIVTRISNSFRADASG